MKVTILGAGDAFASRGNCQAGYLIEAADKSILLDAGPSLLPMLKRGGFDPAAIDLALISHLHGDHLAGLPFLILEYMWESKRRTTLTIAGPRRLEQRTWALFENMFPRFPEERVTRKLKFVVLDPNETRIFKGVKVSTIRTPHTKPDISLAFRVVFGGKTVVFSGDTGWTEELVPFCAGADLFICECTYFDSVALDFHLNYPLIEKHRSRFKVGRMILSHVGREVYEHRSEVGIELASDGMQIEI
ncbi:MAG: MBL fold metallo-hydrolase [Candidatus Binataceae bacterium]